jgi:CubicO group peptidase (beta-lactamase class C family)
VSATQLQSLQLINSWPVDNVAACVIDQFGTVHLHGNTDKRFRLASISKLLTAWATLIAVEDGSTTLETEVGPHGRTLRQLLAHAGGYGFDAVEPIVSQERKRIYSNTGYDMIAQHIALVAEMEFDQYLLESVFEPLQMNSSELLGSAAKDVHSTMTDIALFAAEVRDPRLLARTTYAHATTVQYPDLEGVVPGLGRYSPCPWGLGPEIRGAKHPHWTATRNSSSTFGHFGGSGTFMWFDPVANVACCALADREFDAWALDAWPTFGDAVLHELGR